MLQHVDESVRSGPSPRERRPGPRSQSRYIEARSPWGRSQSRYLLARCTSGLPCGCGGHEPRGRGSQGAALPLERHWRQSPRRSRHPVSVASWARPPKETRCAGGAHPGNGAPAAAGAPESSESERPGRRGRGGRGGVWQSRAAAEAVAAAAVPASAVGGPARPRRPRWPPDEAAGADVWVRGDVSREGAGKVRGAGSGCGGGLVEDRDKQTATSRG